MVAFKISNKVALITGGASGLGFQYALALLEKGARGVSLADINLEAGNHAVKEIESKYGKNKVIFVKTDVTSYTEFEDAFRKTVEKFKNIDILINNAGILNDAIWQKQIELNVNGTIHGVLLGLEHFLPKYKSDSEAVIVNISSIAGVNPFPSIPVYTATKFASHGLTLCWGDPFHYNRTKVRVVGVCPGSTTTSLLDDIENKVLTPAYKGILKCVTTAPTQKPEEVPQGVMEIIEKAETGTIWIIEKGESPFLYKMPNRFEIPKVHI